MACLYFIAGMFFAVTAFADDAPVPIPPPLPAPAIDCLDRFAQLGVYEQIGDRAGDRVSKALRGALFHTKHPWTDEDYSRLSQVRVEDFFPLDERPGGQLSISPKGLKEFGKFLNDYREALSSRLTELTPGGKSHLGNARLSDFRHWLRTESRNGELPLAGFNADLTALVKEYKAMGKDMTLEQLADWLFLHKFLPTRYNAAPADVLQYLRELPPEMSSLIIERAKNVARVAGTTLATTVKNGLSYGLITVVASAVITKTMNAPIQKAVGGVIDVASSLVEHAVTDPLGAQRHKAGQAFLDTLKAMKSWDLQATSPNAENRLFFEDTQRNVQKKLPMVYAELSKDLNVKSDAAKFERQLADKIKVASAQVVPTQEALDASQQKITDLTAALKKLQQGQQGPQTSLPIPDPTAPTADSLTKSISDEQKKQKTLQDQLAAIMTDWLVDRYIHSPDQAGYPDNKDCDFPDATKKAYEALYQNFMTNDHGLHVSLLIQPVIAELGTVITMTRSSEILDKAQAGQQVDP